jgi:pSer/pThr/pTyr-binding forkhead associated (FHA) protein
MWKLTIEDDQANRTVVPLARDEYLIGRGEENTIRLTERNISRRHARLQRESEHWELLDIGSYNGCYVNGARVNQRQPLAHGDLVQLGDYRLELVDETLVSADPAFDSKATVPVAPRSQTLLGQPDRLVMLAGPTPGAEFPLDTSPRQVIGRGEECDISINHPSVSRVHAEVQALGDGRYEIVDRESANGIRVNGVELPRGLLDARDVIELGDVVLKFIRAGEVYVPGADESQQVPSLGGFEAGRAEPRSSSAGLKLVLLLGALALIGTFVLVLQLRGEDTSAAGLNAVKAEVKDGSGALLSEAKALLDKGDVAAARDKVNQLPESSNLRHSAEFKAIQSTWADELLTKAGQTEEVAEKTRLLELVARATEVDSIRRKRAANDLAALGAEAIDVSQLPNTPGRPVAAASPERAATKPQAFAAPAAAEPAPAPDAASGAATLVRRNPFGDVPSSDASSTAAATKDSAERSKLVQTKQQLLAKSRSGTATERELASLRSVCQKLGDASCSH